MRRTSRSHVRIAATVALAALFAAPAIAGSADYLLELGGVRGESSDDKHKNEIEILSYSWGATRASGEKGGTEDINIGVGELQETTKGNKDMVLKGSKIGENAPASTGGVRVAAGDVNGDGRSAAKKPSTTQKMLVPGATKPTRGSAIGGAVGNYANDGDAGTARFNPKEITVNKKVSWTSGVKAQPAPTGSVTVRGKFPGCTVGTRYPTVRLGNAAQRYTLQDVIITSCGSASGEAAPMEEVSFNYGRIKT